jgi:hypothetical protein
MRRRDDLGRTGVALLVAGSILTTLFALSLWSWRTFANSEGFADVAADTLKEPAVAEAVADQIVNVLQDQVTTADTAVAFRSILRGVVAEVVKTEAFRGVFHAGVREMHAAIVQGQRTQPLVQVDDSKELVKDYLTLISPDLAASVPEGAIAIPIDLSQSPMVDLVMEGADLAGWLIVPFAVGATACFLLAVRRTSDRRRALEVVGVCLIAVGAVIFAVLAALLNVVADVGQDPRQRTALRAVFWSAMHVLNVTAKVLIVIGTVIAFAAALAGGGHMAERLTALVERVRGTLADTRAKALLAVVAIALGVLGLIWPLAMAEVVVRAGAIGLVVLGTVWMFDLIGASSWVAGEPTGPPGRLTPRRLALGGTTGVATFSVVLLLGGMSFVRALRAPNLDRRNIDEAGCNGFVELCDRRIDEVAFAGAHNAMAASNAGGFFTARQTGGMLAQLSYGVRAFLVDMYSGAPIKDVVRTAFLSEADRQASIAQLSEKERAVGERFLGMVGADTPEDKRRVYLCHLYCELGATPAKAAFGKIHDWLRVNPNEVIILILEDHVEAEDAVEVLEASGLADRAYTWSPGAAAPTLREMIEAKKNVLVLAEYHRGGGVAPWYHDAYGSLLQDTPYKFGSLQELADPESCSLGRGKRSAPLLLMNHWLDTGGLPRKSLADEVNSTDVLLERAETCRQRLNQAPNIIAIDFYNEGNIKGVIERINHVNVPDTDPDAVAATATGLPS